MQEYVLPISISLVLATSATFPVFASEPENRENILEEIIVTAQRREQSLQETPISVAVFSYEQLRAMRVLEPGDISAYAPNVQINKSAGNQADYQYSIRGIASAESTLTTDPVVGLYMDGVYIARNAGAAFDIVEVERIEVLRGPQGTLFGRNTTGGAINIVSKKPLGEFALSQQISAGSRDYFRSQTSIDLPEWKNLSTKLAYNYSERGGLTKSIYTGEEHGGYRNEAARVAVRWQASDTITVDYGFDWSAKSANEQYAQLSHVRPLHIALGGPYYASMAALASQDRLSRIPAINSSRGLATSDIHGHSLTVEAQLGEHLFKSISAFRGWRNHARGTDFGSFPSDGSTLLSGFTGNAVPAGELVKNFGATLKSEQEQFSQEFQLIGQLLDQRMQYTVGLYYFQEDGSQDNPQSFVLPASFAINEDTVPGEAINFLCRGSCLGKSVLIEAPDFRYGIDNTALAAYGQFTYHLTDSLNVTGGLRWSKDKKDAYLVNNFLDLGLDRLDGSNTWSNVNPMVTLQYQWQDQTMVYGKVATGYRAGGYNARASSSTAFLTPADEENIISYELGLKSDLLDNRARINLAAFHYTYEDAQVIQFEAGSGGASAKLVNAGELEATGVEVDVMLLPAPKWSLQLNYGYTDINIKEFVTSVNDQVTGLPAPPFVADLKDTASEVLHSPKHSAAAIIEYKTPLGVAAELTARLDMTYRTRRTFNPTMFLYDSAKEHTLLNMRLSASEISVGSGSLEVALWGRNLTDEEVRDWGIDFGSLGYAINIYQEMRAVGIDLRYEL